MVLVVEDETLLLQAIAKKLELAGMTTVTCVSGKQALEYLGTLPRLPDGIWLDYYLKDIDGLEFMEELKKNPAWAGIPVVVVTNSASPEKAHRMLALGAKSYMVKSDYKLEKVVETMREIIEESRL